MAEPMEKLDDPAVKDRIDGLKAVRDQAKADADRTQAILQNSGQKAVTPQMLRKFAPTARDHQRVEVADGEVRIMGSKWRAVRDSDENYIYSTALCTPPK